MRVLKFSVFIFTFIACQQKPQTPINIALNSLNEHPSVENATNYLKEANKFISDNKEDKNLILPVIEKAYQVSKENNLKPKAAAYLTTMLKEYPNLENRSDLLFELGNLMLINKKSMAANVLFQSVASQYPNYSHIDKVKKALGNTFETEDIHGFLTSAAQKIFENPDEFGINKATSSAYVDACEAYALSYADEKAPDYLYKAAEIARSLRTFPKALNLYDWIINKFPNYEKTPTALFLKGFVIENELKNVALAKTTYDTFLSKYPDHDLADDVEFLRKNLGKSNEEILKLIESNKAK